MLQQKGGAQINIINNKTGLHISDDIEDEIIYAIRDLKPLEPVNINISNTVYQITKTYDDYYSIYNLNKRQEHKTLYAYTIETIKTQDNRLFNEPAVFSGIDDIREDDVETFLSKLTMPIKKIGHEDAKANRINVFKTTYDGQPVFIKIFNIPPTKGSKIINGLLYEQQIYNYLKTRDERIKKIYKDYFIEMVDIFKIQKQADTIDKLGKYIEKNKVYEDELNKFKIILTSAETFYFLITKDNEAQSLYKYITTYTIPDNELIEIVFEILYGLYLMNIRLNIRHNDLHFNNIMIKQLARPTVQEYRINDKIYKRTKNFQIYIYDFDLSYLYEHPNEYINGFKTTGISNNQNNSYDMWLIISVLNRRTLSPVIKNEIINILLNAPEPIPSIPPILPAINTISTSAKQLFDLHKANPDTKRFWTEMCANFPHPTPDDKRCDEVNYPELHPDVAIERYITKYTHILKFTSKIDYLQKYLKIKQKYLKLKQKLSL